MKILLALLTLLLLLPSLAQAQVCEAPSGYDCWYVSPSGSDSNSGTFSSPLRTPQEAVNRMSGGDYIYLRGGTYTGHVHIPLDKGGTCNNPDCTSGSWSTMKSYPGEWAVLDGENSITCDYNCEADGGGAVIGHAVWDDTDNYDLKYWWFERLEIKNGRSADPPGNAGAGFFAAGGPFRFRYCYIHDNQAYAGNQNPGGLKGHHWHDSIIEYCYFANNGIMTPSLDDNPGNIVLYSDYLYSVTPVDGFNDDNRFRPVARNEIRYNYFVGSNVGIKYKGGQFFTGRNPDAGEGWDDTYNDYGDKVHHNIIVGAIAYGIASQQDFAQIYNNIIEDCTTGIVFRYQPSAPLYKAISYNNQIMNPGKAALIRYGNDISGINDPHEVYGWDYNNIVDNGGSANMWCPTNIFSIIPYGTTCSSGLTFDLSNYYGADNYFYRSQVSNLIRLSNQDYTASGYESQSLTHSPRNIYSNQYSSSNPLYQGTSGASNYLTRGDHVLEGSTTIANGGIGGPHPYLPGVTIPSYVGAVNPDDNAWVAGVLGLASTTYLRDAPSGDPSWIESSGSSPECYTDGDCSPNICCYGSCIPPPSCPNCNDGNPCTTDSCTGQGTCNPTCQNAPITACIDGDSCCPPGCNPQTDDDCEECQTPSDCPDRDCQTKDCVSNQCVYQSVGCQDGDGCCPPGCTYENDKNCPQPGETETLVFGDSPSSDHPGTVEDTYININYEQNSASQFLNTYSYPVNQIANAILMKWDLSAIPGDAQIQEATLQLYLTDMEDGGGDSLYDVSVHRITNHEPVIDSADGYTYDGTNPWTPNSCCYDGIPLAQADIAPAEDTTSLDKTLGYKEWDVTQMVSDWISGTHPNYGMLVNSDPAASLDSNRFFASTENTNLGQRPILTVTYSTGQQYHPADSPPQDGCITMAELTTYIARWLTNSQDVTMPDVMSAVTLWRSGTGCTSS